MITVYSKNNCPFCDRAKTLLTQKGLEFSEIKIDENTEAREFLLSEGHRSVPQIYRKGRVLVEGGFQGLQRQTEEWWNMLKDGLDTFLPSEYQLFYLDGGQQDDNLEKLLTDHNVPYEAFFLTEHKAEYDHATPEKALSCFCKIPNYNNNRWPKLYQGDKLIAECTDDIQALNFSTLT